MLLRIWEDRELWYFQLYNKNRPIVLPRYLIKFIKSVSMFKQLLDLLQIEN